MNSDYIKGQIQSWGIALTVLFVAGIVGAEFFCGSLPKLGLTLISCRG